MCTESKAGLAPRKPALPPDYLAGYRWAITLLAAYQATPAGS